MYVVDEGERLDFEQMGRTRQGTHHRSHFCDLPSEHLGKSHNTGPILNICMSAPGSIPYNKEQMYGVQVMCVCVYVCVWMCVIQHMSP